MTENQKKVLTHHNKSMAAGNGTASMRRYARELSLPPSSVQRVFDSFDVKFGDSWRDQSVFVDDKELISDEDLKKLNLAAKQPGEIRVMAEDTVAPNGTRTLQVGGFERETVNGVLEHFEVDMDKWSVKGARIAKSDRSDGATYFTTTVTLDPHPDHVIHSVNITTSGSKGDKLLSALATNCDLTLFVSDMHFGYDRNLNDGTLTPFHDRRALDIVRQVAEDWDIDLLIVGGDVLDMTEVSRFEKKPSQMFTTRNAMVEASWWLNTIGDSIPSKTFIPGNHEDRIIKVMADVLPMMIDLRPPDGKDPLLSMRTLLGLRDDWAIGDRYPHGEHWINKSIHASHGNTAVTGNGLTARRISDKDSDSSLVGHAHRAEQVYRTVRRKGKQHVNCTTVNPCLCHLDGRVPSNGKNLDWNQGFTFVFSSKEGMFHTILCPIVDGKALVLGLEYCGDESAYVEMLNSEVKGWSF